MKEIVLTQGKIAVVDDGDFTVVSRFKWYAHKKGNNFYAARRIKKPDGRRVTQYLHQFLLPGVPRVDHEDGNGLNDQRYNLRPCTHAQNMRNSRKRAGGSRFKGVSLHRQTGKWQAHITSKGQGHYLGLFTLEEDAARAYDAAAEEHHKEFARFNFT